MNQRPTALERAFQPADSGRCRSLDDLLRTLKAEGLSHEQVTAGRSLPKQLRERINSARVNSARTSAILDPSRV